MMKLMVVSFSPTCSSEATLSFVIFFRGSPLHSLFFRSDAATSLSRPTCSFPPPFGVFLFPLDFTAHGFICPGVFSPFLFFFFFLLFPDSFFLTSSFTVDLPFPSLLQITSHPPPSFLQSPHNWFFLSLCLFFFLIALSRCLPIKKNAVPPPPEANS